MSDLASLGAIAVSFLCLAAAGNCPAGSYDWFWWLISAGLLAIITLGIFGEQS